MNTIDPYETGRMIGQLVVALLGLGILVFALVAIVKAFSRKTAGWIITAVLMCMLSLVVVIAGAVTVVSRVVTSIQSKENTLVSKDGRFTLTVPGAWTSMPQLHGDAGIGAGNVFASQFVIILTEPKSTLDMDLPAHAKLTTDAMVKTMTNGQAGEFQAVTISGHPALRRRITGIAEGLNLVYQHTSVDTGDDLTQIMCWTATPNEKTAFPIFEKIAASFTPKSTPSRSKSAASRPPAAAQSPAGRVRLLIAEQLGVDQSQITAASNLQTDLGADELDLVELVMAVEEEFNITVADETAAKWRNVGDIVTHVEKAAAAP